MAAACEEHYKPVGPGDSVPKDPVSITVALADKLDTWSGSGPSMKSRRGARTPTPWPRRVGGYSAGGGKWSAGGPDGTCWCTRVMPGPGPGIHDVASRSKDVDGRPKAGHDELANDLLSFFHDRLKVMLRDQGARHDLVDAVLAPSPSPLAGEGARRGVRGPMTTSSSSSSA